jgi:hypothetical protein
LTYFVPAFLFDEDLKAGCFAIEYDPVCGSVLAVYYSDGAFDYNYSEYESVSAKAATEDWERWRKEKGIGYCARRPEAHKEPSSLEGSITAEITVVTPKSCF